MATAQPNQLAEPTCGVVILLEIQKLRAPHPHPPGLPQCKCRSNACSVITTRCRACVPRGVRLQDPTSATYPTFQELRGRLQAGMGDVGMLLAAHLQSTMLVRRWGRACPAGRGTRLPAPAGGIQRASGSGGGGRGDGGVRCLWACGGSAQLRRRC